MPGVRAETVTECEGVKDHPEPAPVPGDVRLFRSDLLITCAICSWKTLFLCSFKADTAFWGIVYLQWS